MNTLIRNAIRSLRKQKKYALINIAGLTVGLCACLIVATVVIDDLSYDTHWKRADDIYRVVSVNKMGDGLYDRFPSSFVGLGPELKKSYPDVESYAAFSTGEMRLRVSDAGPDGVKVRSIRTDSSVWEVLDFNVLEGDPEKFVTGSTNIVITEAFRNKFFRDKNPLGEIINDVPAYGEKPGQFLITGVISDIPGNTHLRADIIRIDKRRVEALNKAQYGTFAQQYLLLKPGTDPVALMAKFNNWYKSFVEGEKPYQFELQPIKKIYLDSDFAEFQQVKGSRQNIFIFSAVAVLLLLIACVNFINLSTARSVIRLRDTGVRKVLGASRSDIMAMFIMEAMMIFIVATTFAVIIYQVSIPYIENYLGHSLVQTILSGWQLFTGTILLIVAIGFLTGLYPAWLMSAPAISGSLKGNLSASNTHSQQWLRKSLVVLQFSISLLVLMAMMIVQKQLKYIEKSDIGFNKENLLRIDHVSWDGKGTSFRNEVAKLPGVGAASISSWIPSYGAGYMSREIDDPGQPGTKIKVWYIAGDIHLAKTMGLRLKDGRFLSAEFATDAMNEDSLRESDRDHFNKLSEIRPSLMTETTAKILKVKSLNQPVTSVKSVPVGIVQDFHNQSFHEKLGPTILFAEANPQYGGMLIRVMPGSEAQVTRAISGLWRKFYPNKLFDINWIDEMLAKQYEPEQKLRQLFTFFSLLTMALAALGVLGLVVHAAQQRVKEIGVRKVLGASVASIFNLLSSEFVKLVVIAMLISSPVAWYIMNQWLQGFSYHIKIPVWIFFAGGLITVAAALITVSYHALRAAVANPAISLRNE